MGDNRLKEIIAEIFVDDKSEILKSLVEMELDKPIVRVFEIIDKKVIQSELKKETFINSLATSFFTQINNKLERIVDADLKNELEYVISEISKLMLTKIVFKTKLNPDKLIKIIAEPLKVTCELNNWNYDALVRIMGFDLKHTVDATLQAIKLEYENYYYEWCCLDQNLNDLAYCLKDRKLIKSTTEFKSLFLVDMVNKQVRFNKSGKDFLIVLFDELNSKGFISAKGKKAKHFTPLRHYSFDFEKKLLFEKDMKTEKYRITQSRRKHEQLKEDVLKWISSYTKKS